MSVPLAILWICSPKVSSLSGCLNNLKHFLMDDPHVKLNQEGSALLLLEKGIANISARIKFEYKDLSSVIHILSVVDQF